MNTTQKHNSDKRVIRTKKAIRNALFELMEAKSIDDISISELTAAANVNRRTFYTHYRNMTDILEEIEAELVFELTSMLKSIDHTNCQKSVAAQFTGLYNLVSGEFENYFRLLRIDTRGILVSRLRCALKEAAEVIFSSMPAKENSTAVYASSFMAGGFLAFFSEWYYSKDRIPLEHAAEIVGKMAERCHGTIKELI